MNKLAFTIPFSGFASTTFINCFTSVYLYLQKRTNEAAAATFCNQWENGQCNGLRSLRHETIRIAGKMFLSL